MNRSLKDRHVQMIALGGSIGAGLFLGSKEIISLTGAGVLLSYAVCGIIMYFVVRALAEMSVSNPVSGSFSAYAYEYWGKGAGFVSGWNYWFNYAVISIIELIAVGTFVQFWLPSVPAWLIALVFMIVITLINIANVKVFGETEFYLAAVKIAAILAMIAFGVYLLFFDSNILTGIHNLNSSGGFFPNGLTGLIMSMAVVMFSFGGTELIGITAGELDDPGASIPRAVNRIIGRILIFFIGSTAVILMLFPAAQLSAMQSPYVEVFSRIGLPAAANILNIIIISAALSVYNSALYTNGRMLYSLAQQGNAPKTFAKLDGRGTPLRATVFSALLSLVAVILLIYAPQSAFMYTIAVATAAALINWIMILFTHKAFRNKVAAGIVPASAYKMPHSRLTSGLCYAFLLVVLIAMCFTPGMKESVFIAPLWLIALIAAYQIKRKKNK